MRLGIILEDQLEAGSLQEIDAATDIHHSLLDAFIQQPKSPAAAAAAAIAHLGHSTLQRVASLTGRIFPHRGVYLTGRTVSHTYLNG